MDSMIEPPTSKRQKIEEPNINSNVSTVTLEKSSGMPSENNERQHTQTNGCEELLSSVKSSTGNDGTLSSDTSFGETESIVKSKQVPLVPSVTPVGDDLVGFSGCPIKNDSDKVVEEKIKEEVMDCDDITEKSSNALVSQLMSIIKSDISPQDCKDFHGVGKVDFSVESLQDVCLTLARVKHEGESKDIEMSLSEEELWNEFDKVGNEMIITRTGRRMFPKLDVVVKGLKPDSLYVILVDIVTCNDNRYRFCNDLGRWTEVGSCKLNQVKQFFIHPDGPKPGRYWMSAPISFQKVKIQISSCFHLNHMNHLILESQRRYQPRFHVVQCETILRVPMSPFKTFTFSQTKFYACTTYQSERITQLKKIKNPFAKGFRSSGTATQAASDRHRGRSTTMIMIELPEYGRAPFLAAGGTIQLSGVPSTPPTFGPPKPVPGSHFNVQRKPAVVPVYHNPYSTSGSPVTVASQPMAQTPQYASRYGVPMSSSHPPTMMMSVPLASTTRTTAAPARNPMHRGYPSSEYGIQRVARPLYASLPSHTRPPVNVQWRPYKSGNPRFLPIAQQAYSGPVAIAPRPTLPTSPQIITIPDPATERDSPSTKGSPPERSESTASTSPCPSTVIMDATIKVRLMGSEDFFEVELSDIGETYVSLTECFAEELDITVDQIAKVRKLPNILIRKDRDVKRVKHGSEFEVELVKNGDV